MQIAFDEVFTGKFIFIKPMTLDLSCIWSPGFAFWTKFIKSFRVNACLFGLEQSAATGSGVDVGETVGVGVSSAEGVGVDESVMEIVGVGVISFWILLIFCESVFGFFLV